MSTTKEKIAVMEAFDRGEVIESTPKRAGLWCFNASPMWDWINVDYRVKAKEPAKPKETCEDCTYWLSHGLCTFHGAARGRTDSCDEFVRGFGAKESPSNPSKPKYRDIPIVNSEGRLQADEFYIDAWPRKPEFVGFRYADGMVRSWPTCAETDMFGVAKDAIRATHVVVEE